MTYYLTERWLHWRGFTAASGSDNQGTAATTQTPHRELSSLPELFVEPGQQKSSLVVVSRAVGVQVLGIAERPQGFAVKIRIRGFAALESLLFRVFETTGNSVVYQERLSREAIGALPSRQPAAPPNNPKGQGGPSSVLRVGLWGASAPAAFKGLSTEADPAPSGLIPGHLVASTTSSTVEQALTKLANGPLAGNLAWAKLLAARYGLEGTKMSDRTTFAYQATTAEDGSVFYLATPSQPPRGNKLIDRVDNLYSHS